MLGVWRGKRTQPRAYSVTVADLEAAIIAVENETKLVQAQIRAEIIHPCE